ncbi:MAG: PilN domain-containing protein [Gammaproteobacteria bacterium]|nr:PilN domain-containing protein [Gammaproteobacteria bacterium]
MKQKINLYQPTSEGSKVLLSLDNLFMGIMVLIVALAGLYWFDYRNTSLLEDDIQKLESQVAERKQTVDKLNVSMKSKTPLKGVDLSLEGLKKELELKRQSISKLQSIHQSDSAGFSRYFESLSKNILDGVWLVEFSIYDGGAGFEFKGKAKDGQLVMGFLEGLEEDDFFENKNFSTLEVASGEGEFSNVRFVVNTGGRY